MSELVEIYMLEERPDGTTGIGGNFLVPKGEAVELIQNLKAKAPWAPIGVVPDDWKDSAADVEGDVNDGVNKHKRQRRSA